jgi:uncharacterized membrane protein
VPDASGSAIPQAGAFTAPASVSVRTGAWITAGWELVKQDLLLWALWTLVVCAIWIVVPSMIPLPLPLLIQGPLLAGAHYAFLKKMAGRPVDPNDFTYGFNFFVPLLIAGVLISVFSTVGFILLIIPGLVVSAMFMFSYLFILDRKMDFWPAMQASHEIVKRDYVGFTLFFLVLILLQIAGALALGVGLLITIPVMLGAITVAYREIAGVGNLSLKL